MPTTFADIVAAPARGHEIRVNTTIIAGRCKNHLPILRYLIFVTPQPEGRLVSRVGTSFLLAGLDKREPNEMGWL